MQTAPGPPGAWSKQSPRPQGVLSRFPLAGARVCWVRIQMGMENSHTEWKLARGKEEGKALRKEKEELLGGETRGRTVRQDGPLPLFLL